MTMRICTLLCLCALAAAGCEPECTGEPGSICTWAGTPEATTSVRAKPGTARDQASLYSPIEIEFDPSNGRPYIADWNNHRVIYFDENDHLGVAVGGEFPGDGPLDDSRGDLVYPGVTATTVAVNHPTDIAFDPITHRVVMAVWHNHKIRVFDPQTDLVYVACGRGPGFAGDGSAVSGETRMRFPSSVTVAPDGTLYMVDAGNDRIRRVLPDGSIETFAGDGMQGFNGDGRHRLETRFSFPLGTAEDAEPGGALAFGPDGNLYVADFQNHRIRMIDMSGGPNDGIVTTVVGNYVPPEELTAFPPHAGSFGGDGGPATEAQLNFPRDFAFAPDGTLYVSDTMNDRVRRVDVSTGIITTVAGNGVRSFGGDRGPALDASLDRPAGIAIGPDGNLYIADQWNHAIRMVEL
jgi:trimeric autotransporter adhesin